MTTFRSHSLSSSVHALLLAGLLLLQLPSAAHGQNGPPESNASPQNATSADLHPVLVELFTSEGCSSCPPADALLEKMDAQPIPGLELIVLSEHVTYWDHDGWKDPNSSSELTDRQSSYEEALGLKTPYTPQIIVDGTSVLKVGDRQQAEDIFEKEKVTTKVPIRIDQLRVKSGNPSVLDARIEADANPEKHAADVYVAIALDRVESQVLHGENSGRHLVHVAVVQQFTKVGKLEKGKNFDHTVQLRLKPGEDPKNLRIIAFVQESGPGKGPGKVLGAALRKLAS